jgi:PAS domain S-box-containing protein
MNKDELLIQIEALKEENNKLQKAKLDFGRQLKDLNSKLIERIKEIKCISDITELLAKADPDFVNVFNSAVEILPPAMQYPSKAKVKLFFDGKVYGEQQDIKPLDAIKKDLLIDGRDRGYIEIGYFDESPSEELKFLEEENNLLFSVSLKIGQYLERIAREEAVKKTEERFRNLVEKMNDIFLDFDDQGNIGYVSSSVHRVLGYDTQELSGKSIFSFLSSPEYEVIDFLDILSSKGKIENVFEAFCKHGSKCWLQASFTSKIDGVKLSSGHGRLIDITEKRKVELELQETEALYRSILSATPDNLTITDLEGKVLFSSPKALEMFGYENTDIFLNTSLLNYLDPADHEKALNGIKSMFEGSPKGAEEYKAVKSDGSLFDVEINGEFIRDAQGNPFRMVFITRDISNRKKTEQQLQKTQALFKEMVESINDVIYEIKSDGTIVYVSPAIKNILGYEPAELIGENIFKYMYPEDIPLVVRTLSELSVKKLPYIEYRYYTKDRQIKWVRTSTSPIFENGVLVGGRGSLNDIHELKMAEIAIRENESKFKGLFTSASVGMVMLDLEGNVLLHNEKFVKDTGYSKENINHISQWWQIAFPDETYRKEVRAEWKKETERYFSNPNDSFNPHEAKVRCKDGNDRYFEISFVTTGSFDLITFVDVTERRLATDSLKSQKEYIHSIVNAIPDLMFILSADGVILEFHSGNDKDLALPPEVFLNKKVQDVLPPSISTGFFDGVTAILEHKVPRPFIYKLPFGAELKDFEARFSPFGADKVVALVSNISERIQAEKQIRESEEKLRIIANHTYHWEFWQGPDGKPIYHSPSSEKITGIPVRQLMDNFNWMDNLVHPDDKEAYTEHHIDSRVNHKPGFHHFRIINKKGDIKHIDHVCQPVFDENKNYLGIRGTNVDVTNRILAEKKLAESIRKINVLMNNLKGVAYRCNNDMDWTMDFISNGIAELTGYDPDDFVDNKVRDFNSIIFEDDRKKVWEEFKKV